MGVITVTDEFTGSVAAPRLFEAMNDSSNLLPKLLPDAIKSIEYIQGDGGVGSLVKTTSSNGYAISKIDAIDTSNLYTKHTSIEGAWPVDKIESVVYETKYEASGEGSAVKMTFHFHTKGDANIDEEIKLTKKHTLAFLNVVADHLGPTPVLMLKFIYL